jgi:hypothetical protein
LLLQRHGADAQGEVLPRSDGTINDSALRILDFLKLNCGMRDGRLQRIGQKAALGGSACRATLTGGKREAN